MQQLKIINLISEGLIYGSVDGLKSAFLNDTWVVNANGSGNFTGVSMSWVNGSQDQTFLPVYSDVENEIGVSTQLVYATPIVRTVTDSDVRPKHIKHNETAVMLPSHVVLINSPY